MIFCATDCLYQNYKVNCEKPNRGRFQLSDLRKVLNEKIFYRFPPELREKMIQLDNGDFIRIPTEKEFFGNNTHGEMEPESVTQWEPMKWYVNRNATSNRNYWLLNNAHHTYTCFCAVNEIDRVYEKEADLDCGVRIVFKVKSERNPNEGI